MPTTRLHGEREEKARMGGDKVSGGALAMKEELHVEWLPADLLAHMLSLLPFVHDILLPPPSGTIVH